MSEELRELEIRTAAEGILRIKVPKAWKITFSAVNPSTPHAQNGWALRLYETKDDQRACFTGVISFRDLSIPVEYVKDFDGTERRKHLPGGPKGFKAKQTKQVQKGDMPDPFGL